MELPQIGVMEYWSVGVLGSEILAHHSITPIFHYSIFFLALGPNGSG